MSAQPVTFLVDVDDTLLDNDRVRDDIERHVERTLGSDARSSYWTIQERRFVDLGYRDYLGAVQEWWEVEGRDPRLLAVSEYLLAYPFEERLYPRALDTLDRMRTAGPTIVLTDGDAIFQPWKVVRSGVRDVADGMLVYVHKEDEFDDIEQRYPAERYVLVDDKVRILAAATEHWDARVTTVLPLQGQFAQDAALRAAHPDPDLTIAGIGDLADVDLEALARG